MLNSPLFPILLVLLSAGYFLFGFVSRFRRRALSYLRGPPRPSLLFGHEVDLSHQKEVGDLEFKWFKEFGIAFKASSCLAEDVLMIADPRALQYIFHTSGYRYPKSEDSQQVTRIMFGRGILWAEGEIHSRHRKILNPAFSAVHLRQFLSLFQRSTESLASRWREELGNGKEVLNLVDWLPRLTLDVIGESAFDYQFGALKGESSELSKVLKYMFVDSTMYPRKALLLYRAFRRSVPESIATFISENFPIKEERHFGDFSIASKQIASPLFKEKSSSADLESMDKDVLSVLVRSNLAADSKKQLDEDEVLSQMATLILAGHETTASTTTWLLYELSRHPEDQARVYAEIANLRAEKPDELSANDYDSLPYFNAVIKEVLRMHPIVPSLIRVAGQDDVLPLEFPVIGASGEVLSELPVHKGQRVYVSIAMYNRLPEVWGEDAEEWNPSRFLDASKSKTPSVGVYANLMTFSAGVKGCIGWRFALMELQAILLGLVESFEFSFPQGDIDILRVPAGLMIPMVRDKFHEGPQMPVKVTIRSSN